MDGLSGVGGRWQEEEGERVGRAPAGWLLAVAVAGWLPGWLAGWLQAGEAGPQGTQSTMCGCSRAANGKAAERVPSPEVRRIDFSTAYQYYTFWSPATAQKSRGHIDRARCSWCQAETKHLLIEFHKVRRNVYECAGCARRTVPCRTKSCSAMCKGGLWDSERCAVCSKEIHAWPLSESELSEQREAVAREVLRHASGQQ